MGSALCKMKTELQNLTPPNIFIRRSVSHEDFVNNLNQVLLSTSPTKNNKH